MGVRTLAGIVLLVLSAPCPAQQSEDRIALSQRMWIASKIYATIQQYFGHWQAAPDLNLDVVYRQYVDRIAATDDRLAFDLATMELMAHLRNGHSDFGDRWLAAHHGQPVGFWLDLTAGQWIVRDPAIEGLEPGQAVVAIDGRATENFVNERIIYIAASDDRARRAKVFFSGFLWPESFTLTFKDGRTLTVNRLKPKWKARPSPQQAPPLPDGVVYHRIPSFGEPRHEEAAIQFLKANAGAKLVIFDVRGNGGGSTPEQLLRAVMDRPYRDWTQASSMSFGLFATYGELYRSVIPKDADARSRGYLEGFSEYFERPYFLAPGVLKQPENPVYRGTIFILQDRYCASACEDFVMPLKTSGRATVFGERTFGSSGQPYIVNFENGMGFRVSTKRMYLPDGSQFEGVGIKPDVEIVPPPNAARDVILATALEAFAKQ
jgi:carboxyl-terminal processing protease